MGGMGKPTDRRSEMRRVVEEFLSSGLTRREFCSQRGIALTTFDYWRAQFRSTPRLVKVEVARPDQRRRASRFAWPTDGASKTCGGLMRKSWRG